MTYRHFNLAQLGLDRATLATVATFRFRNEETVASVATVADPLRQNRASGTAGDPENAAPTPATLATLATFRSRNDKSVASVATVADPLDEIRARRNVPSEWTGGVEQLLLTGAPHGFTADMWRQLGEDAVRFLDRWGPEASRLGWTMLDLFGVHPIVPTARYDAMGLVPLIRGREVISITDRSASTRGSSGACLSYVRGLRVHAVPAWSLANSRPPAEMASGLTQATLPTDAPCPSRSAD